MVVGVVALLALLNFIPHIGGLSAFMCISGTMGGNRFAPVSRTPLSKVATEPEGGPTTFIYQEKRSKPWPRDR
jgi:hypothetical protein